MEYQFQTQKNNHRVKLVLHDGQSQQAEIDDRKLGFEYQPVSEHCFSIIINEKSYTVHHVQDNQNHLIFLNGELYELTEVSHKKDHSAQQQAELTMETDIRAPMPGKLLKILVAPGDQVLARQPLFIVESMKMENQVQASMPGRVLAINRAVNDLVTTGDVIIELVREESK